MLERLSFLKWDLPLEREESMHGYLERTIERNGETSVERFNYVEGLRNQAFAPEERLAILLRHPLPEDLKKRLSDSTVRISDERTTDGYQFYTLRGETLSKLDFQISRRRWCPACLAEKSYRRIWFDLVAFKSCPYHKGIELTDRDVHGRDVPWYRTSFDGVDVERRKTWPPNVLEEGTFERYLLGRLGCESHVPVSILDDAKLTSVIAACETIGMLLSRPRTKMSPKTVNPGDANVGFGVLSQGPGRVAERLRDWAMSQLTPTQREGSVQDIFTWAYARSTSKGSYELGPYLLSAFHNAVFLQRRNVKGTVTNEDVEGRRIGIESMAKKLGVSSKFLRKVTEDLGMLEEYSTRRRALRSSQVPAIKDYLDGLIPWRTFREITGLPQEAGTYLVRIGMVVGYVGAKRGVKSVWFRRDQVEGLLTKLRSLPQNTNWRNGFAFRAVVNAHRELPGPLVAKILRGERNVVSLDPKGHFRSVIVECPDKVNSKRAREIGVGDMLLNDAANAIGISRRTTSHLYKIGLLKRIVDTDQLGFRRSDVEAFAEKYITRAAIGRVFGKPSGTIRNMVEAAGVKPILAHNRKGVYDTLYLRRDIEKAFERPFPHHHQDEAVQNLWSLVVQRARDVFPNASLPMRFLSTECWIDTPANEHTAHVVLVADLRVLRFTVAPLRSGVVHDFSIDEQHTPADFDVVFGAMRVRYTQLMQASVESQKRNAAKRK